MVYRRWSIDHGKMDLRAIPFLGSARDINANAWALMHGGVYSPRHRFACHPSLLRKEGEGNKVALT
jgi:hypothetical protein